MINLSIIKWLLPRKNSSAPGVTWIDDLEHIHPQANPEKPGLTKNPGFGVPKQIFKWNNWNYIDKLDRIHRWNTGGKASPYKIILVPSNRCNLRCPYCPNCYARTVGRFKASEELADEQWYQIVREALDMGAKEFYVLGGGEPLLRKKMLVNVYRMIKQTDSEYGTELITNGSLFTPEDIRIIVREKLIDKILFSVDGHTAEIHDSVRGVMGCWKKATDSLRLFHEYKQKLDSDKPLLHMNHIVTNRNYNYLTETVKLCHELGVVELAIHPMREYEETQGSFDHLKLSSKEEEQMLRELKRAKRAADELGIYLNISMVEETIAKEECEPADFIVGKEFLKESPGGEELLPHFKTFCYEPLYSIFIDPKGNANFCCTAGDSVDSQNVARNGLEDIWYGKFLMAIRSGMLAGRSTPKCHNCGLYDITHDLKRDMKKYVSHLRKEWDNNAGGLPYEL